MGRVAKAKQGRRVKRGEKPSAAWLRQQRPIPKPIARVFRITPNYELPMPVVEVWLFRTQHAMIEGHWRREGLVCRGEDHRTMGWCRSYHSTVVRTRPPKLAYHHTIARIYLNAQNVAERRVEVPTHEVGHAAMAYARYRRANLSVMDGEEIMCYALGRMITQLTTVLHATGLYNGVLR